jgi:NTE family protein
MKIGLALSGGGARGIMHTGVLQALHEHHIYPEVISGTSAGAIMGALYSEGLTPKEIFDFSKSLTLKNGMRWSSGPGFIKHDLLRERLRLAIPHDSFEGLRKPFTVSVTNLNSSLNELFDSGELAEVVAASSSIPVIFTPVQLGDNMYCDGGATNNMPAKMLRPICDFVIGVNVHPRLPIAKDELRSSKDVAMRAFEISIFNNIAPQIRACDLVIEPDNDIRKYNLFSFNRGQDLYNLGYRTAMNALPVLEKLLSDKQAVMSQA